MSGINNFMSKKRRIRQHEEISYSLYSDVKEHSRNKFLRKKRNNKTDKHAKRETW